jgi:hypothetical protein
MSFSLLLSQLSYPGYDSRDNLEYIIIITWIHR